MSDHSRPLVESFAFQDISQVFDEQDDSESDIDSFFPSIQQSIVNPPSSNQLARQSTRFASRDRIFSNSYNSSSSDTDSLSSKDKFLEDFRNQTVHYFVFTPAARPVFTYHYDEDDIIELIAFISGLVDFASARGDTLHHITAGSTTAAFAQFGGLRYCAVTRYSEPPCILHHRLLVLHHRLVGLLTGSALVHLSSHPRMDLRMQLGDGRDTLRMAITDMPRQGGTLLGAVPCMTVPPGVRAAVGMALAAVRPHGVVFAVLLGTARGELVQLVFPRDTPMDPTDLTILATVTRATRMRRQSVSVVPVCFPAYAPEAYLFAHIRHFGGEGEDALSVCHVTQSKNDMEAIVAAQEEFLQRLSTMPCPQNAQQVGGRSAPTPPTHTQPVPVPPPTSQPSSPRAITTQDSVLDFLAKRATTPTPMPRIPGAPESLRHFLVRSHSFCFCPNPSPVWGEGDTPRILRDYAKVRSAGLRFGGDKMRRRILIAAQQTETVVWDLDSRLEVLAALAPSDRSDAMTVLDAVRAYVAQNWDELFPAGVAWM